MGIGGLGIGKNSLIIMGIEKRDDCGVMRPRLTLEPEGFTDLYGDYGY